MVNDLFPGKDLRQKNRDSGEYTQRFVDWNDTSRAQKISKPSGTEENVQVSKKLQKIPYERLLVIVELLK